MAVTFRSMVEALTGAGEKKSCPTIGVSLPGFLRFKMLANKYSYTIGAIGGKVLRTRHDRTAIARQIFSCRASLHSSRPHILHFFSFSSPATQMAGSQSGARLQARQKTMPVPGFEPRIFSLRVKRCLEGVRGGEYG